MLRFHDVRAAAKLHGFESMSDEDLSHIRAGDVVKVLRNRESFWVLVTAVKGNRIYGTVDNHLTDWNADLPYGTPIEFFKKHVIDAQRVSLAQPL
jgi:hypothetical protein